MDSQTAYIVYGDENKRYLSGFTGSFSIVILLENKGILFTDSRYQIQAKKEVYNNFDIKIIIPKDYIKEIGDYLHSKGIKQLAFDPNLITLMQYENLKKDLSWIKLISKPGYIQSMRIYKSKDEISKIKEAVKITDKTLQHCLQYLEEGISEKQFANKLDYYHKEFGADGESFNTIVAFAENSAKPHAVSGNKKLKQGNIIKVDFGCFYKGYCSDMTRTFFFGEPKSKELIKIHDIVREAHELQLKALKPGVVAKDIDKIGRDYISSKGYTGKFTHSTGHGIGLEIHEEPTISSTSETILEEGMAITIEPGIYIEGLGGVRIENDVIVTKDGYVSLNTTSKSYDLYNKNKVDQRN